MSIWSTIMLCFVDGTDVNMIHGSDSPEKANDELNFFFPMQQTVAVIKPDAYENKGIFNKCFPLTLTVLFLTFVKEKKLLFFNIKMSKFLRPAALLWYKFLYVKWYSQLFICYF